MARRGLAGTELLSFPPDMGLTSTCRLILLARASSSSVYLRRSGFVPLPSARGGTTGLLASGKPGLLVRGLPAADLPLELRFRGKGLYVKAADITSTRFPRSLSSALSAGLRGCTSVVVLEVPELFDPVFPRALLSLLSCCLGWLDPSGSGPARKAGAVRRGVGPLFDTLFLRPDTWRARYGLAETAAGGAGAVGELLLAVRPDIHGPSVASATGLRPGRCSVGAVVSAKAFMGLMGASCAGSWPVFCPPTAWALLCPRHHQRAIHNRGITITTSRGAKIAYRN